MQRHPLDVISLIFGVLFFVVGLPFLLGRVDLFTLDLSWAWPLVAIALGAALLITSRRDRSSRDDT